MKYISKIFIFSALIGLFFTACEKEEGIVEKNREQKFFTANKTESIGLKTTDFSSEKSTFAEKQIFINTGFVQVANAFFPTAVVGDQRWILADYSGLTADPPYGVNGSAHYNYNTAMSLNNSPTQMNFYAPNNLVELSTWRIPSWDDMDHLHHMVYGDEASIITGLNMQATGMHQWDGTGTYEDGVHVNPTQSIFWCSDFSLDNQGQDTWHLFANDAPNHVVLFQYQIHYPYAPVRLVQDVVPIQ